MLLLLISTLALGPYWANKAAQSSIQVETGTLQGGDCPRHSVQYFSSVPYALPPTGDLRFVAPQPYNKSFDGVYDATKAAPNCLQFGNAFLEDGTQSEDCLYLDIWKPSHVKHGHNLPVKVWLYGGSDLSGSISDPLYNGCALSAKDAVVVSINYRLGPLGWMPLPKASIPANIGLQDQLLALRWVQQNMNAFGGDPSKVLLFGQSAGAMDAFAISSLEEAPQLIKAAAFESGGGAYISHGRTIRLIRCLQALPASQLNTTLLQHPNNPALISTSGFASAETPPGDNGPGPLVDGVIIPNQPGEVGSRVPAIFGSNSMDGTLFILAAYGDPQNLTASNYNTFLSKNFGAFASAVNNTFALEKFSSSGIPVYEAMTAIRTQQGYLCPAYRGLKSTAQNGVPAWAYFFDHIPSCPWEAAITDNLLTVLNATHTSEIPFVFGNVEHLPLLGGDCNFTRAERQISDVMVSAWTSMAAHGNPGTHHGLKKWLPWQANGTVGLEVIGNETSIGQLDFSVCEFWDLLDAGIMAGKANANAGLP